MVTNKSTVVWRGLYSNQQRHLLDLVSTLPKLCCELTRRSQVKVHNILTIVMTNIVVDKSTDQNRFVKLNMADEFFEILVGITVQFYFFKFQGHWLLVKSGTIYYHILYSLSTSSS